MPFDAEVYTVGLGSNPAFDQPTLRLAYTTMTVPPSVYDFDLATREFQAADPAYASSFRLTPMVVAGDGHAPERLDGAYATPSAFTLLRIEPGWGRGFLESDDVAGAAPVALLSRHVWV